MAIRNGTEDDDIIHGTQGDDTINGFAGNDTIFSNGGDDMIDAGDGDDKVVLRDPTTLSGVRGGDGYDTLFVNEASGSAKFHSLGTFHDNGGYVYIFNRLGFEKFLGGSADDFITGYNYSPDMTFFGRGGDDFISGGSGNDILNGGTGDDDLRGFDGIDTCDRIRDFDSSENDRILLRNLDADRTNAAGTNDDFTFIGMSAFSGAAGELRYELINGNTYVMGDTNGDADSDFWIRLDGEHTLTAGDFLL